MACEEMCYRDFTRVVDGLDLREVARAVGEREECMTGCFIARRGSTDSEYCIEKCNEAFNNSVQKTLAKVSSVF